MSAVTFRAFDAALAQEDHVKPEPDVQDGPPVRCRLGLYNPFSFEIAIRPVPHTLAMTCGSPLELPEFGHIGTIKVQGDEVALELDGKRLLPRQLSQGDAAHLLAKHATDRD